MLLTCLDSLIVDIETIKKNTGPLVSELRLLDCHRFIRNYLFGQFYLQPKRYLASFHFPQHLDKRSKRTHKRNSKRFSEGFAEQTAEDLYKKWWRMRRAGNKNTQRRWPKMRRGGDRGRVGEIVKTSRRDGRLRTEEITKTRTGDGGGRAGETAQDA
ncbi:hypothetical protein PoB_005221400 [Plakobranchus ocellatus]|uniref:Uncharacterized protein n=1 Tax=Plakobranchus ocellatus TaxID=259542 RepID=A0AAV4C4U4_9GAST|nr:hypothetical protein PoB_005221400 [Plakobranchus ocellatus]